MSILHKWTYKYNAFLKVYSKMFNFWKLKGNFRDEKENLIAKNTVIEKK